MRRPWHDAERPRAGDAPQADCDDEPPVIPPPDSVRVDFDRRPVLHLADGRALVRRIGF